MPHRSSTSLQACLICLGSAFCLEDLACKCPNPGAEFDFHVKLKEDKVLHPQCLVSKLTGANPSARSPQREIPGFGSGVLGRLLWFIGVRGWGLWVLCRLWGFQVLDLLSFEV